MTRPHSEMGEADARHTLAYLMWCFSEGYLTPEDRAVGEGNWMLLPSLHPDDIATRDALLSMADEILAALAAEAPPWNVREGLKPNTVIEWREVPRERS